MPILRSAGLWIRGQVAPAAEGVAAAGFPFGVVIVRRLRDRLGAFRWEVQAFGCPLYLPSGEHRRTGGTRTQDATVTADQVQRGRITTAD